jgi:hypothetical protein
MVAVVSSGLERLELTGERAKRILFLYIAKQL